MVRFIWATIVFVAALFVWPAVAAQTNFDRGVEAVKVSNSKSGIPGSVTQSIVLPGGFEVDVTIAFESATNLTLPNVGLTAAVIDPLDLPLLLPRLPPSLVTIASGLPVMVEIEPPAGLNSLEFTGIRTVTLHTENLPYYQGVRLRLYSAHAGGSFYDITDEVTQGSYRVRGSGGTFSEFIILLDDRDNAVVVNEKLAALATMLTTSELLMDSGVYSSLVSDLAAVEAHWLLNERIDAVADLDAFTATIVASTPLEIPDLWTVSGSGTNVNGIMRALASTLRFSLLDAPCPASGDYTDTDGDGIPDECDNCTLIANAEQCDSNGDGFGNRCDADLNDNLVTNFIDFGILKSVFLTDNPHADLNCSGSVNFLDLGIMNSLFLQSPGPSGLVP